MKRWFQKLLQIPIQGMGEDDEEPEETKVWVTLPPPLSLSLARSSINHPHLATRD